MPILKNHPDWNKQSVTMAQINYVESLLIDVGLWDGRKAWLKEEAGVEFAQDLTKGDASRIIGRLKEMKEQQRKREEIARIKDEIDPYDEHTGE